MFTFYQRNCQNFVWPWDERHFFKDSFSVLKQLFHFHFLFYCFPGLSTFICCLFVDLFFYSACTRKLQFRQELLWVHHIKLDQEVWPWRYRGHQGAICHQEWLLVKEWKCGQIQQEIIYLPCFYPESAQPRPFYSNRLTSIWLLNSAYTCTELDFSVDSEACALRLGYNYCSKKGGCCNPPPLMFYHSTAALETDTRMMKQW